MSISCKPIRPNQEYVTFPLPPEISISIAPSFPAEQETFEESTKLIIRSKGSRIEFVTVSEQKLSLESISVYIPFTFNKSSEEATIFPKSSCHS